ncbi:MAG: outer membrane beta-barrel protein [Bacteroidota bacterium]
MFNLGDDNELDRAGREAADRYAPPGDPDWQALSAELDKVMPVEKRKRRIFYWWLLPVLLIGGSAAYWLVQKEGAPVITTIKEPVTTQVNKKEDKTASPAETPINAQQENGKPVTEQTEKQTTTIQLNKQADRKNIAKTNERIASAGNGSFTISSRKNKTASVPMPGKDQPATSHAPGKTADQPVKQDQPITTATTKAVTDPVSETAKNNADQPAQPAMGNSTPVKDEKAESAPEIAQQAPDVKAPTTTPVLLQKRGKGFSLGILAGVDKSTVKFKYSNDAGVNIGFLAGYHFSDRWSVHTGAIYTQKNYKVAGTDFTAPKGSWPSYYKIDNVEGYCRMWEIPLMARYTVSQSNRKSIFLSTGLSSYFMTGEKYDYTYYTNSGSIATRNMEYSSADSYIMSILHLSAGFENRISKNLSLQVEPYAKIPLGGVGFGSIRLSSFGLNFSVQYRQPSKK